MNSGDASVLGASSCGRSPTRRRLRRLATKGRAPLIETPREEAFRWVPDEFAALAFEVYIHLGSPTIEALSGWAIFNAMAPLIRDAKWLTVLGHSKTVADIRDLSPAKLVLSYLYETTTFNLPELENHAIRIGKLDRAVDGSDAPYVAFGLKTPSADDLETGFKRAADVDAAAPPHFPSIYPTASCQNSRITTPPPSHPRPRPDCTNETRTTPSLSRAGGGSWQKIPTGSSTTMIRAKEIKRTYRRFPAQAPSDPSPSFTASDLLPLAATHLGDLRFADKSTLKLKAPASESPNIYVFNAFSPIGTAVVAAGWWRVGVDVGIVAVGQSNGVGVRCLIKVRWVPRRRRRCLAYPHFSLDSSQFGSSAGLQSPTILPSACSTASASLPRQCGDILRRRRRSPSNFPPPPKASNLIHFEFFVLEGLNSMLEMVHQVILRRRPSSPSLAPPLTL
ncbi:hypothetical protein R3P38DRAFT_3443843 [Favolaschia claudopus]|uniref:Uncharacterized protein n=1 Tax=Favolaschia claudopus TaxID=2862362 RepID=A0AAV9ZQ63_9AGAR